MKFNIIALSINSLRHLPCTATLTTDTPIGFENQGKEIKVKLQWDNQISPAQNEAILIATVSSCNNGKTLAFLYESVELVTDHTNS